MAEISGGGLLAIYRMYTGGDEKSYIEKLPLSANAQLKSLQPVKGIIFRETPAGNFIDWHTAPRRQYIFQLSGRVEIGLADGSTVTYQPGDVRLVEDATGQGHTTRVVGDQPSIGFKQPVRNRSLCRLAGRRE